MKGVLSVDDEPAMGGYYKRFIEDNFDAVFFSAETSEDAEDILTDEPVIDTVISDIIRPGRDGLDFAQYIHNKYPDISIFIVSGYVNPIKGKLEELLRRGVIKGFLQKPFEISVFVNMLASPKR